MAIGKAPCGTIVHRANWEAPLKSKPVARTGRRAGGRGTQAGEIVGRVSPELRALHEIAALPSTGPRSILRRESPDRRALRRLATYASDRGLHDVAGALLARLYGREPSIPLVELWRRVPKRHRALRSFLKDSAHLA